MIFVVVGSFIVLDFGTGLCKAIKNKTFTSTVMREGLWHKCGSIACILFGALADYAQNFFDLGIQLPLLHSICTYIILMECGSIIENIGEINPNILPNKLKEFFTKLN